MDQPDIFSIITEESKPLRVGQVLDAINEMLQPMSLTVRGEVSSMQERPSAIYFSISDTEEQAKLDCVLFRSNITYYKSFIKEGAEIEVTGRPNIYKPFGKLSFIANQIIPVGEGALKAAFEALKKQLEADGFFSDERKRLLPPFVKNIGLITSAFGDARKDFVTHLGNYGITIHFYDVRVEGVNSISSVVKAIEYFNTHKPETEVLILTRGGGSLESLQAFNSLEVAQAIFKSRIPVISAIGHENDVTIADMVADVRASTPTHAGKLLSEPWVIASERIDAIENNVLRCFSATSRELKSKFEKLHSQMIASLKHNLQQKKGTISFISSSMIGHFRSIFTGFEKLEQSIHHNQDLFALKIQKMQTALVNYEKLLEANDPERKLKQGYSMTFTKAGKLVKSVEDLKKGDDLITKFGKGSAFSSISTIEK